MRHGESARLPASIPHWAIIEFGGMMSRIQTLKWSAAMIGGGIPGGLIGAAILTVLLPIVGRLLRPFLGL